MKYEYNPTLDCFEREDGKGKKIWATMNEAQRIITLRELGNSKGQIQSKIQFKSKKATGYTINTILDKYESGDLVIDMDAPASIDLVEDFSLENRLSRLEDEFEEFKNRIENPKPTMSVSDKVKSWLRS